MIPLADLNDEEDPYTMIGNPPQVRTIAEPQPAAMAPAPASLANVSGAGRAASDLSAGGAVAPTAAMGSGGLAAPAEEFRDRLTRYRSDIVSGLGLSRFGELANHRAINENALKMAQDWESTRGLAALTSAGLASRKQATAEGTLEERKRADVAREQIELKRAVDAGDRAAAAAALDRLNLTLRPAESEAKIEAEKAGASYARAKEDVLPEQVAIQGQAADARALRANIQAFLAGPTAANLDANTRAQLAGLADKGLAALASGAADVAPPTSLAQLLPRPVQGLLGVPASPNLAATRAGTERLLAPPSAGAPAPLPFESIPLRGAGGALRPPPRNAPPLARFGAPVIPPQRPPVTPVEDLPAPAAIVPAGAPMAPEPAAAVQQQGRAPAPALPSKAARAPIGSDNEAPIIERMVRAGWDRAAADAYVKRVHVILRDQRNKGTPDWTIAQAVLAGKTPRPPAVAQ